MSSGRVRPGLEGGLHQSDAKKKKKKYFSRLAAPVRPPLAGEAPLTWLPELPKPQLRAAVLPGALVPTAEIMRQRFCSHRPLAASLHARSLLVTAVLLRLSAGICHRPGGQAGEPLGSWPDAAVISLAPRFLSHFQLCCFLFGTAVHPPPPLHLLPCLSLADKAGFSID